MSIADEIRAIAIGCIAGDMFCEGRELRAIADRIEAADKTPAVSDKCRGYVSKPRPCRHCDSHASYHTTYDCPGYEPEEGGGDECRGD